MMPRRTAPPWVHVPRPALGGPVALWVVLGAPPPPRRSWPAPAALGAGPLRMPTGVSHGCFLACGARDWPLRFRKEHPCCVAWAFLDRYDDGGKWSGPRLLPA